VNTSTILSCFDTSAAHANRRQASGEPANRAATWRRFGDEIGLLRAKSKSENGLAKVRGRDPRGTLIDRQLLS
jgi:hypothetical protein